VAQHKVKHSILYTMYITHMWKAYTGWAKKYPGTKITTSQKRANFFGTYFCSFV